MLSQKKKKLVEGEQRNELGSFGEVVQGIGQRPVVAF